MKRVLFIAPLFFGYWEKIKNVFEKDIPNLHDSLLIRTGTEKYEKREIIHIINQPIRGSKMCQ